MTTKAEAIATAGERLAQTRRTADSMTPREQAEAACCAGGPTVDDLEDQIRRQRGMKPRSRRRKAS